MDVESVPTYRPSGRIAPIRFGIWFLVATAWSVVVAYLLFLVFHHGFYVRFVAPIVAGLLVGAGAFAVVYLGHCRNHYLGGLAGFLLGAGMFLGHYQFDLANLIGFRNIHRLDMLPMWIEFRVQTDMDRKLGADQPNVPVAVGPRNGVAESFRWICFSIDALVAILPSVLIGWSSSTMPYSERHRRWMATHKVRCAAGSGLDVMDAVLGEMPGDQFQPARAEAREYDELQVDYAVNEPDSPVFLSVYRGTVGKKASQQKQVPLVVRRVLTPEQAATLAEMLAIPHAKFGLSDGRPQPGDKASDRPAGRIFELPDGQSGRIMTPGTRYQLIAVQLAPLLLGLIAAIGIGMLAYLRWNEWGIVFQFASIAGIVVVVVVTCFYLLRYEEVLPGILWARKTRLVIQSRPDPVVEGDEDGTVFVEIVPRANWNRLMVQKASDIGFFKVDARRRALLYEGDRERWVIPAESVISCEVEEFTELGAEENKYNLYAVVVLTANIDGRTWEAPLCPRLAAFAPWRAPERRQMAGELLAAIQPVLARRS